MQLRPYQTDIIARTEAALKAEGSAVMQMPTGGGKTRIAAEIVSKADGPVWFICHRQEIERQAAAAFARAGIDFGIISPRGIPQYEKRVQIVSVGTLARRMEDLTPPSLAVWDECQHVAAKSWSVIREQLSSTVHLGLTATPERFDGKGLGEWFSALVTGPSTRDLIDGGYLSEFRYFAPSDPDLTAAKIQAGDYKKADAAKVMNTPVLIGDAIAEYKAKANGKRAIVFAASIDASKAIVERFNAEGILAAHVDGTTPTDERDAAVASLAAGRINVLSNVEVFTEGFDLPAIDAVILMRPTKSVTLFLQMIGRALRKAEGKEEALIFDHAGLWLDHGWFDAPWDWSIEGGVKKRRLASCGEGRLRRCPSCKEVREERIETCRCGYEFPTGRELGEYDGQLVEMRGAPPPGFMTLRQFAKRHGFISGFRWPAKGLPVTPSGIPITEGDAWMQSYLAGSKIIAGRANSGRTTLSSSQFASKAGCGRGLVKKLNDAGMPRSTDGRFDWEECLKWIRSQPDRTMNSKVPSFFVNDPSEYESFSVFCDRIRVGVDTLYYHRWKMKNILPNGHVHIQRGLEWVRDNTDIKIPPEAWPSANDNHQAKEEAA